MCFLPGKHTTIDIKAVQSRLVAAVKHNSMDTASELPTKTLVEACKEAGLKARAAKLNANHKPGK